MASFSYTPSFEATEQSKPRVRVFKAGDGYQQRVRFGLNTNRKEWSLLFTNRTNTERDSIIAFLEARAGAETFDWIPPRGVSGKYICEDWQTQLVNYNNNQIRATFVEVQ
jgi:phage-related protein